MCSLIAQLVERRTVNPQVAGSSPARGAKAFEMLACQYFYKLCSLIAQLVERRTVNPQVAGSSPARGAKAFEVLACQYFYKLCSLIAQLVERRTVNPQVAGSSPARGAKSQKAHGNAVGFCFVCQGLLPACCSAWRMMRCCSPLFCICCSCLRSVCTVRCSVPRLAAR